MISLLTLLAAAAASCGDKPTQTGMTMCQKAVADQADAEMSRVWSQLYPAMQRLDRSEPPEPGHAGAGYAAALLASQRAWLAFRNAECRVESYEWRGGSMQPFTANQCLTEVTQARTRQLRDMLDWTKR